MGNSTNYIKKTENGADKPRTARLSKLIINDYSYLRLLFLKDKCKLTMKLSQNLIQAFGTNVHLSTIRLS